MAGLLGLGSGESSLGQPRASTHAAQQLHQLHTRYLVPIEDMFYTKLYQTRQAALAHQATQSQSSGMSVQFLDAVAKTPGAQLNDQQRRVLEDARRNSMTQAQLAGAPPQQAQPHLQQQPQQQQQQQQPQQQQQQMSTSTPAPQGSTPAQGGPPQNVSGAAQVAAMKANTALIHHFVRGREEATRSRFRECPSFPYNGVETRS